MAPSLSTPAAGTSVARGPAEYDHSVAQFYRQHFGAWPERRFAGRVRWQFHHNPFGDEAAPQWLRIDNGEAIQGLLTLTPLPCRTPAGRLLPMATGDLACDPKAPMAALLLMRSASQLAPLLGAGATEAAERIARAAGDVVVPLSRKTFELRLRGHGDARRALRRRLPTWMWWTIPPVAAIAARWFAATPRATAETTDLPIQRMSEFGPDYDRLWQSFGEKLQYGLDKTSTYMTWRYLDFPGRTLDAFGYRVDDQLRGVVVLGVCTDLDHQGNPCGTTGEIFEVIVDDPENRKLVGALISYAIDRLDELRVDRVRTTGLCEAYHETLHEIGFETIPGARHQVSLNGGPEHGSLETGSNADWYVSGGDGDQLYATTL